MAKTITVQPIVLTICFLVIIALLFIVRRFAPPKFLLFKGATILLHTLLYYILNIISTPYCITIALILKIEKPYAIDISMFVWLLVYYFIWCR
jgi:hypothetical protein